MTINGIGGGISQAPAFGMGQTADSYSRNIQEQIKKEQKELQELSANQDLSMEEKMKKRQEIQQEINNLNMQLREHEIQQRKQQQEKAKDSSMDDMLGGSRKTGQQKSGLSTAGMQAVISADTSMKQAQVQSSVSSRMEGRAGVLEAEIKLDGARGGDTKAKEAELADIQQKAMEADSSQIKILAEAGKTMEEAAKADQNSQSDESDAKTAGRNDKAGRTDQNGSRADETADPADSTGAAADMQTKTISEDFGASLENADLQSGVIAYTPVDIRL